MFLQIISNFFIQIIVFKVIVDKEFFIGYKYSQFRNITDQFPLFFLLFYFIFPVMRMGLLLQLQFFLFLLVLFQQNWSHF